MTKADVVVIAAIEAGVSSRVVEAHTLIDQFHDMIRKKDEAKLGAWIAHATASLVSSLATGSPQGQSRRVCCDRAALVKRPGRSAGYETPARQTANAGVR
jgi:hypothetical protein